VLFLKRNTCRDHRLRQVQDTVGDKKGKRITSYMRFAGHIPRLTSNRIGLLAALAATVLTTLPAHAQTTVSIPGLFNTGISGTGTLLSPGQIDPHYSFINGATTTQAVVTNFQGPNPYAFDANSRYIWGNAQGTPINGVFTLRLSFNLTGLDFSTAQITGAYSTDNAGTILLNGTAVGTPSTGFGSFTPFSINSGFVAGVNNLDFVVTDTGAAGALAVTNLGGTARSLSTGNAAPEPTSLALLLPVMGAVGVVIRRRRKK
jgi:hypothetical protein